MLEQIFGSRTRVKLLKLFLTHPGEYFFVREITRKTEEKINSVRRELANLEEFGLIITEDKIKLDTEKDKKEKKKYYRVNPGFVLYNEFKNLIMKSHLLLEKSLAKDIKKLGKVYFLALTGFFVDDADAKIDLIIVGNLNKDKVGLLIKKLEKSFEQDIRYTLMTEKEFNFRNQITDKFLFDVLEGKNIVIVDERKH